MNVTETSPKNVTSTNAAVPRRFLAPGPGTWMLDVTHCQRPRSRWMHELFEKNFAEGFRVGFERYGALLDTIEYKSVEGFPYLAVRPIGAPPDAKGTPPRFVFALLIRLHPGLRRRVARCTEVLEQKPWRGDVEDFAKRLRPASEAKLRAVGEENVAAMDDHALADHLQRVAALTAELIRDHFRCAPCSMIPVGELITEVQAWTGCEASEVLRALRGSSPESISPSTDVEAIVAALRGDPALLAAVEQADDARALLDRLCAAEGTVGPAVRTWLAHHGERVIGGHDVTDLRAIEVPATLVGTLRAALAPRRASGSQQLDDVDVAASLRARVPEAKRAAFDTLLAEARAVYGFRDARMSIDYWSMGLARRALLEAGSRLAARSAIFAPDHVFDLQVAELDALLRGKPGPDPATIAAHATWRAQATIGDAPEHLGPPPSPPPPAEWLPGAAGRIARAVSTYLEHTNERRRAPAAPTDRSITGVAASGGRYVGTARIVRGAEDFAKIKPGDVLVAPITTPTFNVILPLLGAIVTDRGGLLSHPAIVSREYGIPAVVGTRNATKMIPEGAKVEVDADRGTVRVVS